MPFKNNPGCSCCEQQEVCTVEHDFEYVQLQPIDMRTLYVEGSATTQFRERYERIRLISDNSLVSETKLFETWNYGGTINFTQSSTTLYTDRFGGGHFFKNVVNTFSSETIISSTNNPDGTTKTEVVDVFYDQSRDELRMYGASTYDQGVYARIIMQYYRRRNITPTTTFDQDTNNGFGGGGSGTNQHVFYPNDPIDYKISSSNSTANHYPDKMPDRHVGWAGNNNIPAGYGTPTYQGIPTSGMGCAIASSTYQFTDLSGWTTLFEEVVDQYLEVAGSATIRRGLYFGLDDSKFDAQFVRGVPGSFYWDDSGYTVKAPFTQADSRYITIVSGPQLVENVAQTGYDYYSGGANGSYTTDPIVVFTNSTRESTQPTFSAGQTSRVDDLYTLTTATYTLSNGLTVDHITNMESATHDWGKSLKLELFDTKRSNINFGSQFDSYAIDSGGTSLDYQFNRDSTSNQARDHIADFETSYVQDWYDDIRGYLQTYPHPFRSNLRDAASDPFELVEYYADANRWNMKQKISETYDAIVRDTLGGVDQDSHMDIIEDGYVAIKPSVNLTNDANAFKTFSTKLGDKTSSNECSMWTAKKLTITTFSKTDTTCSDHSYLCSVSDDTVDTDDSTYNPNHTYLPVSEQISPFRDFAMFFEVTSDSHVYGGSDLTQVCHAKKGCVVESIEVRDPSATYPANHIHFAIRATFSGTLTNCDIEFKCWAADTSLAQVQTDTNLTHDTFTIAGIDFTDPSTFDRFCREDPDEFVETTTNDSDLRHRLIYKPSTSNFEVFGSSPTNYLSVNSGSVPAWFSHSTGNGASIYFGSRN